METQELLNKLHFAFTDRQKPHLAVAIYESEEDKAYYCQVVQEKMAEYQHLILDASGDKVTSLVRYLQEKLPQEVQESDKITQFVHIWGLENSFYEMEEGKLQPSLMLPQINLERELIFRNQPILLLLWLTPSMVKHFQQKAIDFWDWITDKFHFEARYKDSEPLEYDTPLEAQHFDPQVLERIAELEQKLKYQDASEINARYFKQKRNILTLLYTEEMKVNRWDSAIKHIQQVQNILDKTQSNKEDELDLWIDLADCYYKKRDFVEANQVLDKALSYKIEDEYGLIFHRKGRIYEDQRQWTNALESYHKAIEWDTKTNNLSQIGGSYHKIGNIYFYNNKGELVLENYLTGLEYDMQSNFYNNLSVIFFNMIGILENLTNDSQEILDFYQAILDKYPAQEKYLEGFIFFNIALLYRSEGNQEEEKSYLEKAIQSKEAMRFYNNLGNAYYFLSMIIEQEGNTEKAFEMQVKALAMMLSEADFDSIEMLLNDLMIHLQEFPNHSLVPKAQDLLAEAQKRGFEVV